MRPGVRCTAARKRHPRVARGGPQRQRGLRAAATPGATPVRAPPFVSIRREAPGGARRCSVLYVVRSRCAWCARLARGAARRPRWNSFFENLRAGRGVRAVGPSASSRPPPHAARVRVSLRARTCVLPRRVQPRRVQSNPTRLHSPERERDQQSGSDGAAQAPSRPTAGLSSPWPLTSAACASRPPPPPSAHSRRPPPQCCRRQPFLATRAPPLRTTRSARSV